jgi:uncharacterized BrkB/YihY/UPF0761 family membrane protein
MDDSKKTPQPIEPQKTKSNTEEDELRKVFGDPDCASDPIDKFSVLFGLVIIATILFGILASTPVQNWLYSAFSSGQIGYWINLVIFFVVLLIIAIVTNDYRQRPLCDT